MWPHFAAISTRARAWLVLHMGLITYPPGEETMFEFQDLFQWDRFITPTIIKTFYWLVIALICLFGLSGIFSGLAAMAISPFGGFLLLLSSIASVVVGIVFSRIVAEFILIVFRINEHLGAIRDQGQMR
jgi:predicted membrane metal-binding protein